MLFFFDKFVKKIMSKKIIMYSTAWCPDCRNAKRMLNSNNVQFDEVDIDQDESAANKIIEWSGGRRVIPTFHITDNETKLVSIMHNPNLEILKKELEI